MLVPIERGSILDITYDYTNYFFGDKLDSEGKKKIYLAFYYLLKQGWILREMYDVLNLHIKDINNNPSESVFCKIESPDVFIKYAFSFHAPKEKNILEPGVTYFHNQLRILPQPVTIDFDVNTGLIIKQESEYFMEFRASYTLRELGMYFLSKGKMYNKVLANESKRVLGALQWLMEKHNDVELILYMIDAANLSTREDSCPSITSPTQIQDFYEKAIALREFKKNECSLNGDTKVVPRKRVLSSRSGLLDRQKQQAVL